MSQETLGTLDSLELDEGTASADGAAAPVRLHGAAPHGGAWLLPGRRDQARGDQARGDQARRDQARRDQARRDQARGDEARGDEARGDEARLAPAVAGERSRFASVMALGMLVVILIGFGPTFFLRAVFDVPEIPLYLIVHGAICTAWFSLLLIQTRLAARGRARTHRRLGICAAVVALAMVASGIQTSLGMVPRRLAGGMHLDAAELDFLGVISSANFSFFFVFPTLIALALYYRRRADVHRRLMLIASISIVGPAAMRISSWLGEIPNPITSVIVFGFFAALIANDIATRGRPHAATIAAAAFAIGVNVAFQLLGIGDAVIGYQMARGGG